MVDDNMDTLQQGEANHFTVDVWGINPYRGFTFTNIWKQFHSDTKKPALISEYGYSTAYYPAAGAQYDDTLHYCPTDTYPKDYNKAPYYGLPAPRIRGRPPGRICRLHRQSQQPGLREPRCG